MIQMRTDVLKAEYLKLFQIKEGFKNEVTDVKKKNIRIQRKIDEVEIAIEGMLEVLDADQGKKRDPLKVMNPKMRQKLMADKKKRERELLQKKMAAGVDFLGDNDVKFSNRNGELSFFEVFQAKVQELIDNLKPFRKEVREIQANYDRSISLFFELVQDVFVFTLFTAVLYSYIIIAHWLEHKDEYVYFNDGLCGYTFPCHYFLSRYTDKLQYSFVLTNFAFGFTGLAVFMYMWIQFDKKAQYQKIFQSDGIIYARQAFNAWSWNINDITLAEQRQNTISNEILLLLKEDLIKDEVNKRTPKQK